MQRREPSVFRSLVWNVWLLVCVAAAVSCVMLVVRLLSERGPLAVAVAALLGSLASLYGVVVTVLLTVRSIRLKRARSALEGLRKRVDELESLRLTHQASIEELSMLREVATVVSQESDFGIIAGKVLELIHGLLEPLDITLFVQEDDSAQLQPFAQYTGGKVMLAKKVLTRSIPDFSLSEFESHSVICRVRARELHAIVPLKVEERTLGVVFLTFPTDARSPDVQRADFDRARRQVLLEIAHHISLAVKTKHLQTQAVVDGLTRLYSRSHFNAQLQAAVELAQRKGEVFSLLLVDIDHFKQVNDTYGHSTGDVVLKRIAQRIRSSLRKYDAAYRYGGEELAVLLPRTHMKQAVRIAERFRNLIEAQKFRGAAGMLLAVTASFGVAQFQPTDDAETLFNRADRRLYRAKHEGRNRVVPAAA